MDRPVQTVMGRHARPLGGTEMEPAPELALAGAEAFPGATGRRRAPQPSLDAPSPPPQVPAGAGRHRAPAIPMADATPAPDLGRVSAPSRALDRAETRPKIDVPVAAAAPAALGAPAAHRRRRAAPPKRRIPVSVPVVAGAAAVAVTAVGGVTLNAGSGGVTMESVAGAGTTSDVQRVAPARVTRAEMRAALTSKEALQARSRAQALRDARLAEAAAARLAALQRACGYNPYAQRDEQMTSEMLRNARIIIDVSQRMNLPPRAAVIAIATALQESYLKNLSGGHLDSAGLFQQRPSAGWGSYGQVTNPLYSARKFYTEMLEDVGSAWRRLPLTVVAQDVQVSAFPWAYARWEAMAAEVVSRVLNVPVDSLNCTPR